MRVATARWLGVLALTLALTLGTPAPAGAEAQVASVPTATPGRFDFVATGFAANEMVSTWLTGPSQQVVPTDRRKVDHQGGIAFSLRLRRHFEPGRWAITVGGWESGREAIGYFDLPPFTPDIPLTVSPTNGPASTTFTFAATGFDEGEQVSAWLTAPDGQAMDVAAVVAGRNGRVAFTWVTTEDTPAGPWMLTAYGQRSDRLGLVRVTVD